MRTVLIGVAVMLAFLAATNRFEEKLTPDTRQYEKIALAAPGLSDEEIGSAFAERLASPWLAGTLGEVLPGGARTGLWLVVGLSIATMLGLLVDVCRRLGLGAPQALLCTGLLALNPYTLRLYLDDPAPVDPLLVAGVAIVIWALVAGRLAILAAGAIVAISARQTALLAVPAAMSWLLAAPDWRPRPARVRIAAAVGIVALVAVLYAVFRAISESFSFEFAPAIPGDTILPVIGDPGSIAELGSQALRVAAPLAPVLGAIAGALAGLWWSRRAVRLPVEFWCALLIAAAIIVQPLVISPDFRGFFGNQARISALGVLPLCVALAYALRAAGIELASVPRWALAAGALLLAGASLNDQFSVIGPSGNAQFVAIELLAALGLGAILALAAAGRLGERRAPV